MIDLNKLSKEAYIVAKKRELNGAKIKADTISMLKHCAGEVIEAQEAFMLWKYDAHEESKYAEELADVIICALIAAKLDGIDIERAISLKMQINAQRAAMQGDKL